MVNQQLLEYIRQQISSGISKEVITKALESQGWSPQDVNEAFVSLSTVAPPIPQSTLTAAVQTAVVHSAVSNTESKHTATIGKRVLNSIIDPIFLYIFSFGLFYALKVGNSSFLYQILLGILLGWTECALFYVLFESIWQRTPAKWITQTKVVNLDGTKPGVGRIILRTLCRYIPFDGLSFLFGRYPYGWHDRFSKTMVVPAAYSVAEAASVDPKNKGKSSTGIIILLVILFGIPVVGILSGVVLAALGNAKSKGQSALVQAELSLARTNLELYNATHNDVYPDTLEVAVTDIDASKYTYSPSTDKKSYTLCLRGSVKISDCVQSPGIDTNTSISTSTSTNIASSSPNFASSTVMNDATWSTFTYVSKTPRFPSFSFKYPASLGKPQADEGHIIKPQNNEFLVLFITFPISDPTEVQKAVGGDVYNYDDFHTNKMWITITSSFGVPLISKMKTLSLSNFITANYDGTNFGYPFYFIVDSHPAAGARVNISPNLANYAIDLTKNNIANLLQIDVDAGSKYIKELDTNNQSIADKIVGSILFIK